MIEKESEALTNFREQLEISRMHLRWAVEKVGGDTLERVISDMLNPLIRDVAEIEGQLREEGR